ncbi:MAG: condensation domain-containing protein [Clostridia bacterium]|nr:condensation domain-containing protein [Clostridia bacterium]
MYIRCKLEHPKSKIDTKGKQEGFENKVEDCETAFLEFDLDLLFKAFSIPPSRIINLINDIEMRRGRSSLMAAPSLDDTGGIPKEMPANGHDIYNYVARFGSANFQIQAVMELDGRLDPGKLKKAVRLSMDAEPVFGCRFVEGQPPYWKRRENLGSIKFCTVVKSKNPDKSIQDFLESPLDMDYDPMVKLKLIQSDAGDILCLKVNHACCDGTGTKEYLQLLSDIYNCLDQGDTYVPIPRKRTRKDQDRLFYELGIKDPESAWDPKLEKPKMTWQFPWRQGPQGRNRSVVCQLPKGEIIRIGQYGKYRGATINDLIVTAFYRVMFEMSKPQPEVPMNISMTVDLRRYLPDKKTEAIRCFSGAEDIWLERIANESFEGTLSRVIPGMNKIKRSQPGLQSAVGLERVEKADFSGTLSYYQDPRKKVYTDQSEPVLSNLGFLNKSCFRFGKILVTDAYIVPPVVSAPGLLLCAGTYNDILTMSISYYDNQIDGGVIKKLLQLIKKELMEGCTL